MARKAPFTVLVTSELRGRRRIASTITITSCPPSKAGIGSAFMTPRLMEMRAIKARSVPCFPASAPICITPTGPARLPTLSWKCVKSLPNPKKVSEVRVVNCRFVIATASTTLFGFALLLTMTLGASLTPITPSPLLTRSGLTSSGTSPSARFTTKCIVLPLLFFTACTRSETAFSLFPMFFPSISTMTSPGFIPYLAPAPLPSTKEETTTPWSRTGTTTPLEVTEPKIAPHARIMLNKTPAEITNARWMAGRF
mmetsp:Transcript_14310/g.32924  ORF Transcript_14310/g.32924 Transcript_14310/m.32924 type:complete len:254 (+) Transcript_14310:82-843(+)